MSRSWFASLEEELINLGTRKRPVPNSHLVDDAMEFPQKNPYRPTRNGSVDHKYFPFEVLLFPENRLDII